MVIRFYLDPATGQPHILEHGVDESEVEDVLATARGATVPESRLGIRGRDAICVSFTFRTRSRTACLWLPFTS